MSNWNITGDNRIKKVFKVPVSDLNRRNAEELIAKLMEEYQRQNPSVDDYWFPVRDENFNGYEWITEDKLTDQEKQDFEHHFNDEKDWDADYHCITDTEIWNELTTNEKVERIFGDNKIENSGVIDWNVCSMEYLADYLDSKYMFSSSSEAFAIMRMVDFYRAHKDNI